MLDMRTAPQAGGLSKAARELDPLPPGVKRRSTINLLCHNRLHTQKQTLRTKIIDIMSYAVLSEAVRGYYIGQYHNQISLLGYCPNTQ
jgi:hypothetical protein